MAPNRDPQMSSTSKTNIQKPQRLSMEGLQRTISDISYELTKVPAISSTDTKLPPISEIEDAKCECCGMSEECTPEYINRMRDKHCGKLICGLCAEAVNEEMEKNGGKREDALNEHVNACVRFNRFGRKYPVLCQAEAIKEILKKSSSRAKSMSPRDKAGGVKKGGLARSSSCIPAITQDNVGRWWSDDG